MQCYTPSFASEPCMHKESFEVVFFAFRACYVLYI